MAYNRREILTAGDHAALMPFEKLEGGYVLLREHERHGLEAVIGLDLTAVYTRLSDRVQGSPEQLMESLAEVLRPGWWLELVYSGSSGGVGWKVFAGASGEDKTEALQNARLLYSDFQTAVRTGARSFTFQVARRMSGYRRSALEFPYCQRVRPIGMDLDIQATRLGFCPRGGGARVRLSLPLATPRSNPCRIEQLLRQHEESIEVRHRITRGGVNAAILNCFDAAMKHLQNGKTPHIRFDEDRDFEVPGGQANDKASRQLALWLYWKGGIHQDITIHSSKPVSPVITAAVAAKFGMEPAGASRPDDFRPEICMNERGEMDLRDFLPCGHELPGILPDPGELECFGVTRTYNHVLPRFRSEGIILGEVRDGAHSVPVRFHGDDRTRHCYLLGATGTGKSTLLANMIVQDMENGEGLTVLDPHGDLFRQVLLRVPSHRHEDLVIIDPTNEKWVPGINFLECSRTDSPAEANFVINELMKIFQRLYLREQAGPIFETFMRTALLLLLGQREGEPHTLLDVPRLFEDPVFRQSIKESCTNPIALRFWERTAEKATGESSLVNTTAYVTSKLNQFVYNGRIRNIIGQRRSTINFREVLDGRRIVLINLAKGQIGQLDSEFLGMILLGKIFSAALGRSGRPAARRIPHYLYIDEFQNFTTDTVSHMMSESRKFELRLILANQNFDQLESCHDGNSREILSAVLGNAASMLTFRTGVKDAGRIRAYLEPEYDAQDIQYLPDFHVAAKLLVGNVPTRPFVFCTAPFPELGASRGLRKAIERSREKYSAPLPP